MRTLPFQPTRYFAAFLAVVAGCVMPAWADIELPSVPPPQPQPATAKVYIGESVEIPLSGVSRSGAGMQFVIRRQPASGKLSEIRMTGPNTAVVTYTHLPVTGAGVDHFRYAATAPGIGISTPAEVTVNISERPAVFTAPARLDFPDTSVGQTSTQTFEIRNDGGGLIEGQLSIPPPWKLIGSDGSYSLGAGGTLSLTIAFTPTEAQLYSATAKFSHAPDAELGLAGSGYHPIEVVPREIRLETDGRNEVRTGAFLLRNVSLDDHELRIIAPPEVIVQDSIKSPGQSEAQVALHTRAGFLGELNGKITITGEGVSFDVPLHVTPAPVHLAVKPAAVDFGTLDTGRAGHAKITIHNAGGSPADLNVKLPEGVEIVPYPSQEKLEPGASKEFELRISRPLGGPYSDAVSFESAESVVSVPVKATIRQSWSPSAGASQPAPTPEMVFNDIPPVMQVGVTRQTRTELDLAWKKTSPNVANYVLLMRSIVFDSKGKAQFKYERLDRVKVRFVRDEARVTLAGLRAGESVTLCIFGVDADGVASHSSPPFTFATQPKPVFHIPWVALGILAIAVLAAFIVRERRRQRIESDREVASIGQL